MNTINEFFKLHRHREGKIDTIELRNFLKKHFIRIRTNFYNFVQSNLCSLTYLKPFKSMAADVYNFYFLGIKRVNLSGKNLREKNDLLNFPTVK